MASRVGRVGRARPPATHPPPVLDFPGTPWQHEAGMDFEVIGSITEIELIARGLGIRDRARLNRSYGRASWRKLKGRARIRLRNGRVRSAELHWYEAHGIGRRELKRKLYLD
jgi:hypothetical protein